jgi:tRNA (guanine37-N1)-methyltransferase
VRIDVVTIFPGIFESPLRESLLGRAIGAGLVDVSVHDLRDATADKHRRLTTNRTAAGRGW